jgi:hypothetical protein
MEMQVRGWREERTTWTKDTTGRDVPITTGLTKDRDGRLVAVIAIGADGPSAIMRDSLSNDITETFEALGSAEQAGR